MKPYDCLDPQNELLGSHALEASAGTGKTFAIQHIVARLLQQNFNLDEILIVTFTRAATRELKARIRQNMEALLNGTNPPPYYKPEASFEIEKALTEFDSAQIFTIHGFCQKMLTEYAFEANRSLHLQSEKDLHYRDLLRQAIGDFFRTSLPPEAYSTHQLAGLMKHFRQNKDKLVEKILYFVEQEAAYPTYPEFQATIEKFLAVHPSLPQLALEDILDIAPAFKKICDKNGQLKNQAAAKHLIQALKSPSPETFDRLLQERPSILSFFTEENRSRKTYPEEKLEPLYTLREKLLPLIQEAGQPHHTLIRIARSAQKKARALLLKNEIFSPDDLLKHMEEALKEPAFTTRVSKRYRAVIIDEFQDTDATQWNIFKTLFIENPTEAFYIVGDPKQSIYGFRSADLATYFAAKEEMKNTSHLSTNYRSDPTLLKSLNELFSKQEAFSYENVLPAPTAADTPIKDNKKPLHFFVAEKEKGREQTWPSAQIEKDYYYPFIAEEIQKFPFKESAILVKDRYQAARLKTYLENLSIPVATKSTEPLVNSPLYTLMRAFLETIERPAHVNHLLAHPIFGLTHQELKQNQSLLTASLTHAHHLKHLFHTHGLPPTIDAFLNTPWKDKTLLEHLVKNGQLENYSDFMQLAELLIEEPIATLNHLQNVLEALRTKPADNPKLCRRPLSDQNAVTIMTIHMSKGLEFPIVFALGLVSRTTTRQDFIRHGKKWHPYNPDDPTTQQALQAQQAEKYRQLYVALTRAKKRLYVPYLIDTKETPTPPEALSPIELLLPSLPSTLDQTKLEKHTPQAYQPTVPTLHAPTPPKLQLLTFHIHSFSSLSKHKPPPSPDTPPNQLPKGTQTGLLLHTILENIIQEKLTHPYNKEEISNLIKKTTEYMPYKPWQTQIETLIDHTFSLPLDNFTLKDIAPQHLYPEIEFLYSETSTTALKGFADLIFFHQNRYYILDWKTNLLPDYTPPSLKKAMEEHNYTLQAKIYTTALSKYLTFKKDPAPIAGAYYIFLRGAPTKEGVHFIPAML